MDFSLSVSDQSSAGVRAFVQVGHREDRQTNWLFERRLLVADQVAGDRAYGVRRTRIQMQVVLVDEDDVHLGLATQ